MGIASPVFAILPDEDHGIVTDNRALLHRLLAMNIEAEEPKMAPSAIAEIVLSFFSGLCIERNLKSGKASSTRKIENFKTAFAASNRTMRRSPAKVPRSGLGANAA